MSEDKPTIKQDIDHLKHMEPYQRVMAWIEEGMEYAITDLVQAPPDAQPTMVGKVAAYKEILEVLLP